MRQYTRPSVKKWKVASLAKELGFCFDQNGFEPPMYFLTKDCKEVLDSRSLEEINGFLHGVKYRKTYDQHINQIVHMTMARHYHELFLLFS